MLFDNNVSTCQRCVSIDVRLPTPAAPTSQLSVEAAKTLVRAYISSRFDYCNSLLFGISGSLFRRLQAVQNAAAHPVANTQWREHITPS